ncbi:MAG: class I SAM-dependent methyltransferase [Flavobacterium sp.]|nr:MAG: class I SAM-dependent methyltransferase [Flavobacterium sp.]
MDLRENAKFQSGRHPWELSRFSFFLSQLREHGVLNSPLKILDVGAGDGWFLTNLANYLIPGSEISGVDLFYDSENKPSDFISSNNIKVTFSKNFEDVEYDLILLLDVLEHVEDDFKLLDHLVTTKLKKGGVALISVPAWPKLFSNHDRYLHHIRRYLRSQGRDLVARSGLKTIYDGGVFHLLVPLRGLTLIKEQIVLDKDGTPTSQASGKMNPIFRGMLMLLLSIDLKLAALARYLGVRVPGLTWWTICTK